MAKLRAAEGVKLVVGARREVEQASLVGEIEADGRTALALAGGVRPAAYGKALVALAVEKFGRLDNAGTLGGRGRLRRDQIWPDWPHTDARREFGPRSVRVNAILPGAVENVSRSERHCQQTGVYDQSPCAEA